MIDSIYLALSGMLGHERALNVLGNNVTNMNTLGFRGSTVSFADVFLGTRANGLGLDALAQRGIGGGVDASRTTLDFRPGTAQNTGGDLDALLDGDGFFIVQDETGAIRYTRAGSFDIVDDELVLKGQKVKVLTRDTTGQLMPIDIKNLLSSAGQATSTLSLEGNFKIPSSNDPDPTDPLPDDADFTIESVDVFEQDGSKHTLQFKFTFEARSNAHPFDVWRLSATENDVEIGTADLEFIGQVPQSDTSPTLHLELAGGEAIDVTVDFSRVQSLSSGSDSTVTVSKQDGFGVGQITGKTFDVNGVLKLSYSNGQSAAGPALALAQFIDQSALVQLGDALFEYHGSQPVTIRDAGDDLKVTARALEGSNVDLTTEFSQLILMQRGYQASSQVMSTANDMLQQLLDLRGRR
jgi:flagellar hook protein FlgE